MSRQMIRKQMTSITAIKEKVTKLIAQKEKKSQSVFGFDEFCHESNTTSKPVYEDDQKAIVRRSKDKRFKIPKNFSTEMMFPSECSNWCSSKKGHKRNVC